MSTRTTAGARLAALPLIAVLGLAPGPRPARAAEDGAIQRIERQIELLRQELEELKRSREAEVKAAAQAAAEAAAAAGEAKEAAAVAASAREASEAAGAAGAGTSAYAAAGLAERVQIGGYGSARFEYNDAAGVNESFDFRRLVLTADAQIAPRLSTGMELEFERFRKLELERSAFPDSGGLKVEQEIEGTNKSEITMEQAWFQYALADPFRFRIGAVLVPVGRFNIHHDDDRWDLPRRPLVDRGAPALPAKSAWAELGMGFNGDLEVGDSGALSYQFYVVNGATLEPEFEEVIATRDPKRDKLELEAKFKIQDGPFASDPNDNKAVTGRVAFSPALGHEVAASVYHGRYTPDFLGDEDVTTFAFDGLTEWGPFQLEGEYVYSDFGNVGNVVRDFAAVALRDSNATPSSASPDFEAELEFAIDSLAEKRQGYWLEARYDLRPECLRKSVFGRPFADPLITAVLRGEQVWTDGLVTDLAFSDGAVSTLTQKDHRIDRVTAGLAYRPVPSVALQLAYEYTHVDNASLATATNFLSSDDNGSHAVLFGTAFGF